jgi:glycosyltransferase involved in cell wall biosynthesis
MPRASFVIPAYNAERYVSKAIFSCRNQTIKQIEIVVVNDGSQDGTGEIIDWHAKQDPRVVPVHLEKNVGRSEARNIGNDKAASPLLFVLDADDMAARNRVKDTIALFELKKPDFVYGSFFVIDSLGNTERKIICSAFDQIISKAKKLNFICHSTVAYRKALAQDVRYEGGEYSKLGLDDWKFQWDVCRKGYAIKHIRNPLAYYRDSGDTISSTRDEKEVARVKETFLATF